MLNKKSLLGKLLQGTVGILAVFLTLLSIVRVYEFIIKRLPVSKSQIQLAKVGISHNEAWKPTTRQFNGLDWALVPAGCFQMGSTESQLEEALGACKVYGGGECKFVFDSVTQPGAQVCFEKPYWINTTEITNRQYGSKFDANMNVVYPMRRESNWPRDSITWQAANQYCT